MTSLTGKIAIVTGASSGIGAATAHALAGAGATLVLVARRADRLAALAADLGADCLPLVADMAEAGAPQCLHDRVMAQFGRADILVNNAGILHAASIDQFDLDQLRPMIALNYEAVVRTCTLFGRSMKAAGTGQIINISSIGANIIAPGVGVQAFTATARLALPSNCSARWGSSATTRTSGRTGCCAVSASSTRRSASS